MDSFWEKPNWEDSDPHFQRLRTAPFQRGFPFVPTQSGFFLIRGPRQIGKSSWLKHILSQSVQAGRSAFYLSCENVRDHQDLNEILRSVRSRDIVLLDEVSFVQGWDRAVKHAIDSGHIKTLVATGSHAVDLRQGADRMPGRWGHGGEFTLLPMEFHEFQQMRAQAGWKKLNRVEELELYFRVGGFPIALIEAGPEGRTPTQAMETYRRWICGDIAKLGKQEIYLKEILAQVALTTGSTISLQKLAQKTQAGSHHTAQAYVETLEDCFALKTLFAIDPDDSSYRFKKEKKFYFRDPLIYWLALDWAGIDAPEDSLARIAELVAHEYFARRSKRFGYLSTRNGEVDFIAPKKWAIEVKWSPVANNLSKAYKALHLAEKIVWTHENFLSDLPNELVLAGSKKAD